MNPGSKRIAWLMVCVVAAGFATPGLAGLLYVAVFFNYSAVIGPLGLMVVVSFALSLILCALFDVFRHVDNWRAAAGIAAASVTVGIVATFSSYYTLLLLSLHPRH